MANIARLPTGSLHAAFGLLDFETGLQACCPTKFK